MEMHALHAKSLRAARPQWLSVEKHIQAQVLAVPSNTCLLCMGHPGTPVHATSVQPWHPVTCLCSHTVQQQLIVHKPS